MAKFLTVPLDSKHGRANFSCGNQYLDNYIQKQVKQDIKRKLAACFVLSNKENEIKGYYTLSNAGIPREQIPENIRKKLPRAYYSLPVTLLGRMAVDERYKGQGLGKLLLIDALKRAFEASGIIGSMAVVVDPIDAEAVSFYQRFGFILLPDSGKMFLPMKTIELLMRGTGDQK
ncbi:MAG: GNAT family N-acetyltransferase [Saprospirales bacterium]|nr:GNAT family N-acetyltransferase [Saprospirales bacterium]|tara:strand:+ start:392 stop:913 length:522 start_codon:yes stop_codon:yes gene_type:complete